jgi:hypothetical protein
VNAARLRGQGPDRVDIRANPAAVSHPGGAISFERTRAALEAMSFPRTRGARFLDEDVDVKAVTIHKQRGLALHRHSERCKKNTNIERRVF